MGQRTNRLRNGNRTGLSRQWLLKLLAISPFVVVSTMVVDQKPMFAGEGGVQYETCTLPDWYDATGEKKGDIDPDSGECVPNGCISSGYQPKKCQGFGPTKDSFEEPLVCPAGTLSDGGECLTITQPEEILVCLAGTFSDGDQCVPIEEVIEVDPEVEVIKQCSDGSYFVDGQCVVIDPPSPDELDEAPRECPSGFSLVDGKCLIEEAVPPSLGVIPSDSRCWVDLGGSLAIKIDGECRWPGRDGDDEIANQRETLIVPDGARLVLQDGDLSFGRVSYLTVSNGSIASFPSGARSTAFGIDVRGRSSGLSMEFENQSRLNVNHVRLSEFPDVLIVSASSLADVVKDVSLGGGEDAFINDGVSRLGSLDLGSGNDYVQQLGRLTVAGDLSLGTGNDRMITNDALSVGGFLDGGEGDDVVGFFSLSPLLKSFPAAKIKNIESTVQLKGSWAYAGAMVHIDHVRIHDGVAVFNAQNPAKLKRLYLKGGRYAAVLNKDDAPIQVSDRAVWKGGTLFVLVNETADAAQDPEGRWKVIDGDVEGANEMANNVVLVYGSDLISNYRSEAFQGVGVKLKKPALFDVYLEEGSLNIVVERKTGDEVLCSLGFDDCDGGTEEIVDPKPKGVEEVLPGCSPDDALCSLIQKDPTDSGADPKATEYVKTLVPLIVGAATDQSFDLSLSFDYGQLARLLVSGLSPRNIDGAGRGMATFNNLLADVVFERLPLRQFDPVVVEETVVEQEEVIEESAPPVRGLWNKSGEVSDQQAQQALDQAIAQAEATTETTIESLEASGFVEDTSLTAQYARRDGVRAWFRGFGGDDHDSYNDNFYNPYYVNAGGGVLGVDVSVTDNFQIGAFANYGNINLIQQNTLAGGGSWNSNGWGGGVKADYWTDNFYVQGLFSATGFSGNQKREIIEITDQLGDETASGDKSATSYGLAFRVGAPFEAGKFVLEPQFTTTWSFNNEHRFTESGAGQLNLTYKERSTTYVQTDLAMKFSYPINTGETSQLVPSLRVGWLGDWSGNLSDQTLGYRFTNKEATIQSANEDTNGVLIEGGLDYTIANVNTSSYKVYVRGGIEAWGGARGTDYRASGGFEWQF